MVWLQKKIPLRRKFFLDTCSRSVHWSMLYCFVTEKISARVEIFSGMTEKHCSTRCDTSHLPEKISARAEIFSGMGDRKTVMMCTSRMTYWFRLD